MSELSLSSTSKTTHFSSLLMSDLRRLFSFILSHPLYFSYFIFFSPCLIKLLSFLSPLFLTTSLFLLAFLTLFPCLLHNNSALESPESKLGFFLWTYHFVTQRLRPSKIGHEEDEEFTQFEEFEAFKMVFELSNDFCAIENSDEVSELKAEELCFFDVEEKTVEIDWEETTQPIKEAKRLQGLLKDLDYFEKFVCNVEEKKVELPGTIFDKVEVKKEAALVGRGSEEIGDKISRTDNGGEYTSKFLENPNSKTMESNLGSYGSMRRGIEWKRTLACKLFEERHNLDGSIEGMDSLWETYEMDSSNKAPEAKGNTAKKKENKNKKKGKSEYYSYKDDDEAEDKDEEEGIDGQLCCLQALKFSAGKMNMGMGRPNLVKISKAIKGFGWLHNVTSKHGKKGAQELGETHEVPLERLQKHDNEREEQEGMDSLWETYKMDSSNKAEAKGNTTKKKENKNKKKGESEYYLYEDDDEAEDENEGIDGQLCCLQALKFSAGKMNMGMGRRPNLVNISKAIKRFGRLYNVTSRHGKKGAEAVR